MRRQGWPPPKCRKQPSPTMNLRCACDRFCVHPRPCLHVNFTCMRALIPSPVPACLPSLPRTSLALSQSEFESLYMRALTPTHVPAGFRQSGSRSGQPAWPITGLTTRVFRRPLLSPTPRVIEYSDDIGFLFHRPHLSYHLPAPLPDNYIMIVIVVSVWIVLFI